MLDIHYRLQLLVVYVQLFRGTEVGCLVAEHANYSWQDSRSRWKQLLWMSDSRLCE